MSMTDFEKIKSIDDSIKLSIYGYVRRCQELLPDEPYYNLTELIIFRILLYFDEPECFEINNQRSFNFIRKEHGYLYHVFGKKIIKKEHMDKYEWKLKTEKPFNGRIGIIDANKVNHYKNSKQGENIVVTSGKSVAYVRTFNEGKMWGKAQTKAFVSPESDITHIIIDFASNKVMFRSETNNNKAETELRKGINSFRFFVEFWGQDTCISFM